MIIRTITCHDVYNFGASLQAFALQHYLESLGHDVRIIHYKPDYLNNHYSLTVISNPLYNRPILKQLYILAKFPGRLISLKRRNVFDAFTDKYLHLTRKYCSYQELRDDAPDADIYIAGSDQIWNTLFKNGRDRAFYLDFGKPDVRRISFAASFATSDVIPQYRQFVSDELHNFDACSVREKTSLRLLRSLGRVDGIAVCDPVFLISKDEWNKILIHERLKYSSLAADRYVLVYLCDNSDIIRSIIEDVRKETGYRIYAVGPIVAEYADRNIVNAGPLDFVQLVRDAQFVVSNSFHATVFSLVFGKRFCVVNRVEKINERMLSILLDFDMVNRLVNCFTKPLLDNIDISKTNSVINSITEFSKAWLNKQLRIKLVFSYSKTLNDNLQNN